MSTTTAPGLDELAAFVLEQGGRPIDVWAIAALLESRGTRDLDAREDYGLPDVFALAAAVQERLPPAPVAGVSDDSAAPPVRRRARRLLRLYGRGVFFVVPLGLQLVGLLVLGVSQFAAIDFTQRQASLVALAAALGFLASAGFGQGLGYLGPLFEAPGKHALTERLVWRLVLGGVLVALVLGGLLWGLSAVTGAYDPYSTRLALGYFVLVTLQALPQAVAYMLHRYELMLAGTLCGLAVVAELHHATGLPIYVEHWIGLSVTMAVELVAIAVILRRRARRTVGAMRLAQLPRAGLLGRRALPYAVYGLVYFAFLIVDRLVAWSIGSHPFPFWFSTQYELGLDWALGAIVLALAFLEVAVDGFSGLLTPLSERYGITRVAEHNRELGRYWSRQLLFAAALMVVGGALAVGLEVLLAHVGGLGPATGIAREHATRWTFAGGLAGYALLTLGLANSIFLLSLARPWPVVRAMVLAAVVSAAVGIAVTTQLPYYAAVLGMVAGAACFAVATGWVARSTLARADYWTYAAW